MNPIKPELPKINKKERTPLVDALLELVAWQDDRIEQLEQKILELKGETTKPDIQSSSMDEAASSKGDADNDDDKKPRKRRGPNRSKNETLRVDETIEVHPNEIPEGAVFKGYQDAIVQDLIIKSHNTCYKLAQYQLPDGSYVCGKVPQPLRSSCGFGSDLISFVQHQYHGQVVTQPLILKYLHDLGVEISAGQVNHFINGEKIVEVFHQEKDEVLSAGIQAALYLHTDDTKARHAGKNGYCTHIGNELFAWFSSTESKSRINFLELLSQGVGRRYTINDGALEYMAQQKLPKKILNQIETLNVDKNDAQAWEQWLNSHGFTGPKHRKILTEGALFGGLLAQDIPVDLSIISDDAGQFNVFDHALCWIHAERIVNRLIPVNELQEKAVDWARSEIWGIYAELKDYKLLPTETHAKHIKQRLSELILNAATCG